MKVATVQHQKTTCKKKNSNRKPPPSGCVCAAIVVGCSAFERVNKRRSGWRGWWGWLLVLPARALTRVACWLGKSDLRKNAICINALISGASTNATTATTIAFMAKTKAHITTTTAKICFLKAWKIFAPSSIRRACCWWQQGFVLAYIHTIYTCIST